MPVIKRALLQGKPFHDIHNGSPVHYKRRSVDLLSETLIYCPLKSPEASFLKSLAALPARERKVSPLSIQA